MILFASACMDQIIREVVAAALGRAGVSGEIIGSGLYAAAVVRVDSVAVKVYKNAANRFVHFHRDVRPRFDLACVQRSMAAGIHAGRGYAVLEYIDGTPLDFLLDGLDRGRRSRISHAFLHDVLTPLWSQGLRFWDFRAANIIVGADDRLTLIDADCLLPGLEEMLHTPGAWSRRQELERLAFKRLPGLVASIENVSRQSAHQQLFSQGIYETLSRLGR